MKDIKILSWNIGNCVYSDYYCVKDRQDSLHFKNIFPAKRKEVFFNLSGITSTIKEVNPDIVLLQEVTKISPLNRFVNTYKRLKSSLDEYYSYYLKHYNILGFINHGKAVFSKELVNYSDIKIPVKMKSLKDDIFLGNKTVIKTSININGSALVIFNVHFIAFSRNELERLEQLRYILELARLELSNGHDVIIGGDFNMDLDIGSLSSDIMDEIKSSGFNFIVSSTPTLRSLAAPYSKNSSKRTIDGFLCSSNIEMIDITNLDTFKHSDHSPIVLNFRIREIK